MEIFCFFLQENCAKATEMINSGRELLELDYIPDDRDWIRERLDRLEDAFNNFSLKFDERKKTLKQSMHFHTLIEQVTVAYFLLIHMVDFPFLLPAA